MGGIEGVLQGVDPDAQIVGAGIGPVGPGAGVGKLCEGPFREGVGGRQRGLDDSEGGCHVRGCGGGLMAWGLAVGDVTIGDPHSDGPVIAGLSAPLADAERRIAA
jgi:hypothetical protein